MQDNSYQMLSTVTMWEINMIAFIRLSKIQLVQGKITTKTKACGVGGVIGNKGGV